MKKLFIPLLFISSLSLAQSKAKTTITDKGITITAVSDSLKLSRTELTTLQRNALIIQQNIHMMHLDALLRDKLDSVYSQSAVLFDDRLKKKP